MLASLGDLHVWIESPDGQVHYPHRSSHRANYNLQFVESKLTDVERVDGIGFTGRTEGALAVAVVTGLPAAGDYDRFLESMSRMREAPGFVVDLRRNHGGSEPQAARIAGFFTDRRTKYARAQVRSDREADGLLETPGRYFDPSAAQAYKRPVVCLIGPGCVSSGEGFALMMKSLDHVQVIGQPTRGASGNPRPVTLPNGVRVWFSRWVSLELDGTPIEGRGVYPETLIDHTEGGDVTFERGLELLRPN